jgi:serine/threonine protein kinase
LDVHDEDESNIFAMNALKDFGKHEQVACMLAFCPNFDSSGPSIFFEVADLGDAVKYRHKFCKQERDKKLGLDFLHSKHGTCLVQNDFKPENILVFSPLDHDDRDGIPVEPIFKIADFARLWPYSPLPTEPKGLHGYIRIHSPPRRVQSTR